jgi:hypothetical protein
MLRIRRSNSKFESRISSFNSNFGTSTSALPAPAKAALFSIEKDWNYRCPAGDRIDRKTTMTKPSAHKWTFRSRFRGHAFGWKPGPAINRLKSISGPE